jgi:Uma2 family endonuclease
MIAPAKTRMTAAEFFDLPETTSPEQLIEGELIVTATPVPLHQRVSRKTLSVLDELIPNGELFYAPISLYIDQDNVPEPDILWIAENSRCTVGRRYLEGPPDLIVEIFSPSTEKLDRTKKFRLYERFGVTEYWMINPEAEFIEVYTLQDGKYQQLGIFAPGETFASPVLNGAAVNVTALFA